jgi:cytosine/adenosine deaminase-related metal-dependent hydrolase
MPAGLVWYLATEGGARALGLEKVGRVEPGWQADLQLIQPQLPTPLEAHNLFDQLLLYCSRSNVGATMVAGNVIAREGIVNNADIEALSARTREQALRLWEQE